MSDQPTKPREISERDRYEYVLLCDLEPNDQGKDHLVYAQAMKWRETVLALVVDDDTGLVIEKPVGFLVTVPPMNSIRIYSHVCRTNHAEAIAFLEKDRQAKARTDGRIPTVWNGKFNGCPLCAVASFAKSKEEKENV